MEYTVYTATDEFYNKVLRGDQSFFARTLADYTSGMKRGETKTVYIYGGKIYVFVADGYLRGYISKVLSAETIEKTNKY